MSYTRSPWPASPLSGLDDDIEKELTRSGGQVLSTVVNEGARLAQRGITAAGPKADPAAARAAAAAARDAAKAAASAAGGVASSPLMVAAGAAAVVALIAVVVKKARKRRL